jgi:muconolactone delta-isomerase
MLFNVNMAVHVPHEVAPETIKQLTAQEHQRATRKADCLPAKGLTRILAPDEERDGSTY